MIEINLLVVFIWFRIFMRVLLVRGCSLLWLRGDVGRFFRRVRLFCLGLVCLGRGGSLVIMMGRGL